MLSMIKMFLTRFIGNNLVVTIIMTVIENFYNYGNEIAKPCLVYIVEASGMDVSNEERFNYVLNKLEGDFPDVGSSFLRTTIESVYDAWDSGKLQG